MTHATKLRLRAVDGLLDDIQISLPVSWAAPLRAQSVKLGMSLADLITQYCGHLSDQVEALDAAVQSPHTGDDPSRFVLRGSFQQIFQAEALRCGLPVRAVLHRVISDAAASFAGRAREPLPKPIVMVPGQKKLRSR